MTPLSFTYMYENHVAKLPMSLKILKFFFFWGFGKFSERYLMNMDVS